MRERVQTWNAEGFLASPENGGNGGLGFTAVPLCNTAAEQGGSSGEVLTRGDIAEEYKWRLEDMYGSLEQWEQEAQAVREFTAQLSDLQGHLGDSADTLLQTFRLQDEIGQRVAKLYAFAKMRRDEDNTHSTYQALTDKAMVLAVQVDSARSFFVPELLGLPEQVLQQYLNENEGLSLYRFAVEELLRQKPHVLSAPEEQLLAEFGEVANAPSQIFTMFNDADLRFPKIRNEDGQQVELTHGRYIQFMESRNREVRKSAFDAMYQTYGKNRNTLAAIHGASVKKDVFYAKARRYPSAREAALSEDNVPVTVYDNLIDTVHDALPALHKYLALRKRVLGLDSLHVYDLYTPMVAEVDWKIPYAQAVDTVIAALHPMGSEYQQIAQEGLHSGWVDVYETQGKTSGAYSWGAYGVHPYMLLNYHESLDNMFTLAHELGHSMHTHYSQEAQPYVYSSYTIFVAEVASTCNEALLTDHLLKNTDDAKMKAYLLNHQLETLRGTLYRQTLFAEFEKWTHAYVEEGGALTPEWLCATYYDLNHTYYGAQCVVDKDVELEWARIPHFYSPFYVYKYATGISASTALAEKILHGGAAAVEAYTRFLKGGGSDYPIQLLRGAGVDMESPEPVRAALSTFSQRVDQLAALLES
ncbi:oligoendopeptidase F [Alicyclobacillaceae bacterium I2511]|nr:oligoendopeptidase F [Alicyclobacillaceae bacterium I2511]